MGKRLLSVSYDVGLLTTRRMLLEQRGYEVISALGFNAALECCRTGEFDLFILGHSVPHEDKIALIHAFRENCDAPILSLQRKDEEPVPRDFNVSACSPEELIKKVESIVTTVPDISPQDP
jgi:DNA-binding response OmpR family regulator